MRSLILVMLLSGASVGFAQNSSKGGGGNSGGRSGSSSDSSRPSLPMPGAALPASLILLMLACRRIIGS